MGNLINRKVRRAAAPEIKPGFHKPRHKTGQPAWFRKITLEMELRRALARIPVSAMGELSLAVRESLKLGGYKNVWQLSRADARDLLKLKGIGPATLRSIHQILVGHDVPVYWQAN